MVIELLMTFGNCTPPEYVITVENQLTRLGKFLRRSAVILDLRFFDPAAQDLGHTPGLGNAAARSEGWLGIKDFTNGADARFVQMGNKTFAEFPRAGLVFGMNLQPRIYHGSDEPGPDSALMVGGVSRAEVAEILRFVILNIAAESAQPHWCEQSLLHDLQHRAPILFIQNRMFEGDGQELIGP